jgi:DNA-binding transcriptional MerR regulator
VRLYEQWGFIPKAERGPNGYRRFEPIHLALLKLARTALHGGWPGRPIRRSALAVVQLAASGRLAEALEKARQHLELVRAERAEAEGAAAVAQRWAREARRGARKSGGSRARSANPGKLEGPGLQIREAAREVGASIDQLHGWERNGLIRVPRRAVSGYREYHRPQLERLRVIRMLLQAGYSIMAIRRMLRQLDRGERGSVRRALDTPRPDEDVLYATDRWLSELSGHEARARKMIEQLEALAGAGPERRRRSGRDREDG